MNTLLVKIILLQGFWFLAVLAGPKQNLEWIYVIALLLAALNYKIFKVKMSVKNYILFLVFLAAFGFTQDYTLYYLDKIQFSPNHYPLWLNSMYIVFIAYYEDVFKKLPSNYLLLAVLGGFGGVSSYFGGYKLGALEVDSANMLFYLGFVFAAWFIFFTLSIFLYERLSKNNA